MPPLILTMSALLAGIACVSFRYQLRTWRRLHSESLASDDRRYLRGVFQRRTLNAALLLGLAGMLAGSYFSGGLEELGRLDGVTKEDLTEDDRAALKSLVIYWMIVLGLVFFVMAVAISDYVALGLYGRQELRRIRTEQRDLLERDLAMVRQQKLNDRLKRLK